MRAIFQFFESYIVVGIHNAIVVLQSFQTQGIYFVLIGMEVWADANKIIVNSSNADTTLDSWCRYRMKSINPFHYNDNAVLLT